MVLRLNASGFRLRQHEEPPRSQQHATVWQSWISLAQFSGVAIETLAAIGFAQRLQEGREARRFHPLDDRLDARHGVEIGRLPDVEAATKALGSLTAVIANAGVVAPAARLAGMSAERMRHLFEVDVLGAFLTDVDRRTVSNVAGSANGTEDKIGRWSCQSALAPRFRCITTSNG